MGFLNFVPKVESGDLKFGEQKSCYCFYFFSNFALREPKVFESLDVLNFKTVSLKTGCVAHFKSVHRKVF